MNHQTYLFNGLKWNLIQSENVTWIFDSRANGTFANPMCCFLLLLLTSSSASRSLVLGSKTPFFSVLLIWCGCTIICVSFLSFVGCFLLLLLFFHYLWHLKRISIGLTAKAAIYFLCFSIFSVASSSAQFLLFCLVFFSSRNTEITHLGMATSVCTCAH